MKSPFVVFLLMLLGATSFGFVACVHTDPGAEVASSGEAFYVEPMEFYLSTSAQAGARASSLKAVNKNDHETRVRIDVFERSDALDGSERRVLTKDVKVDLAEFSLPAGQAKELQIAYVGENNIPRERAFRVVVKQVEEHRGGGRESSLDLRFVYEATVYVTPEKAEPNVIVKDVKRRSAREVEVEFRNIGNAHQKMSQLQARLERVGTKTGAPGIEIALSDESRKLLARQNILAGARRKLLLRVAAKEKLTDDARLIVKLIQLNKNAGR